MNLENRENEDRSRTEMNTRIPPLPTDPAQEKPKRVPALTRAWESLTAPHSSIQEIGARRQARLLATLTIIFTIGVAASIVTLPRATSETGSILIFLMGITVISFIAYLLSRTKVFILGAYLLTFGISAITYMAISLGMMRSVVTTTFSLVPFALIFASTLLPQAGLWVLTIANSLAIFLLPLYSTEPLAWSEVGNAGGVILIIGLVLIGFTRFRDAIERSRLEEIMLANIELGNIKANLEQRVSERTSELSRLTDRMEKRVVQFQAIAEVSSAINTIQRLDILLPRITEVISQRFDFYHVGIFLLDQQGEYAVLRAANSEGGMRMLARNHRLRVGEQGIVGYVTQRGTARVADDTGSDAVYFDNPDLPDTHSEIALPLKWQERIVGALDVQSTMPAAFSGEDIRTLSVLADAVTIAIQNANLFEEGRRYAEEMETIYRRAIQQGWSQLTKQADIVGYQYTLKGARPLHVPLNLSESKETSGSGKETKSEMEKALVIPVKLRGESVGILQIRSVEPGRVWKEDEIALVESIAERAALAIENARLFDETTRRAERERVISEVTTQITSSIDVDDILRTTAQELGKLLIDSEVIVQLTKNEKMSRDTESSAPGETA